MTKQTNKIFQMMCQLANVKHRSAKTPTGKILYYFADTSLAATDYSEVRALRQCIKRLAQRLELEEKLVYKEVQSLLGNEILSLSLERGERDGAGFRQNSYELWVSPKIEKHIRAELGDK